MDHYLGLFNTPSIYALTLVPVPVALCPFFNHISAGKIEHFFQGAVTGKYTFGFSYFPVLAVQPLYDICGAMPIS